MKIKINTSPIFNLIMFMAIADCGIFAIFSVPILKETGVRVTIVAAISALLFLNCIVNKTINTALKPYRNFINFYMILLIAFIAVFIIYSYSKYGQGVVELFNCFRHFIYLFMVSPLIYIFTKQNGYERVLNAIVWLVIFIIIIHAITALIYNYTGILIFPEVKFGIRSERLRCHVPSAFGVVISFIPFKIFEEKLVKNKIKWLALFCFVFVYLILVSMTRMILITVTVTLLVIYLLRPRPKTNQIFVWLFVTLIFAFLWASGSIDIFLNTFTEGNEEYGNSTTARQVAIDYFSLYTKDNPVFSMGFVCPTNDYFHAIFFGPDGNCCFDDLGIINMWYHFGILGVIIVAVLFVRLIYLFIKIYYINKSKNRVLFAGMLAYIITSQISLSVFDIQRIFSLVCIWAMFEYEAHSSSTMKTKFHARSLIRQKIHRKEPEKIINSN